MSISGLRFTLTRVEAQLSAYCVRQRDAWGTHSAKLRLVWNAYAKRWVDLEGVFLLKAERAPLGLYRTQGYTHARVMRGLYRRMLSCTAYRFAVFCQLLELLSELSCTEERKGGVEYAQRLIERVHFGSSLFEDSDCDVAVDCDNSQELLAGAASSERWNQGPFFFILRQTKRGFFLWRDVLEVEAEESICLPAEAWSALDGLREYQRICEGMERIGRHLLEKLPKPEKISKSTQEAYRRLMESAVNQLALRVFRFMPEGKEPSRGMHVAKEASRSETRRRWDVALSWALTEGRNNLAVKWLCEKPVGVGPGRETPASSVTCSE